VSTGDGSGLRGLRVRTIDTGPGPVSPVTPVPVDAPLWTHLCKGVLFTISAGLLRKKDASTQRFSDLAVGWIL
jgi:hypothetical protein